MIELYILISGGKAGICLTDTYGGLLTIKSKVFEFKSRSFGPLNTFKSSIVPFS